MVKSVEIAGVVDVLPENLAQYEEAFTTAAESMNRAMGVMCIPEFDDKIGWTLDSENSHVTVHYKDMPEGRWFAGRCVMPVSPDELLAEIWERIDTASQWNSNIKLSRIVHKLTPNTDIVHIDDYYMLTCSSVQLPHEIPEDKNVVRGILHMGAGRYKPFPGDVNKCIYDYVICMDLKGVMFRSMMNKVMGRLTLSDIDNIRKRMQDVADGQRKI